ncbi:hypothetical protein GCM10023198_36880 [Promicromonospora umidemergens]|uniref:Lipopolysaccharide export system protein LptC n=2 Tax=Promicromonospora umidemergens TaxID=629679 RepID=A0ABP8XQC5_9MICO
MSGGRWWSRAATAVVTAAALVGVYLVPAGPVFAASEGALSEADRAAAAAAAAPPAAIEDEGGNWFTDLFGGDDAPEADPVPADAELAPEEHPVGPEAATPAEPGERVRELKGKRTANTRTFLLDDGQRQVEVAGEPLFYETARDGLVEIDTTVAATGKRWRPLMPRVCPRSRARPRHRRVGRMRAWRTRRGPGSARARTG